MIFIKILILGMIISLLCSIFYICCKVGAVEGAKTILNRLPEAEKLFLLQQKYLESCSQIEKEYYRLGKDGIFEFTDEKGEKRKVEFQKGININEFKTF
jgi:hypothetical protein